MTMNIISKIAMIAIVLGGLTMYLSSIPYTVKYSQTLEIVGSIPFYGGIAVIVGLFILRIGK